MSRQRCCHIKLNGARCAKPALSGEEFCKIHDQRMLRARIKPLSPPTHNWATAPLFDLRYTEGYDGCATLAHAALDGFVRHQIEIRELSNVTRQMDLIYKSMRAAERLENLKSQISGAPS